MNATVAIAIAKALLELVAMYGPEAYAMFERIRKSDPKRPIEQVIAEFAANSMDVKALEDEIKARHGVS